MRKNRPRQLQDTLIIKEQATQGKSKGHFLQHRPREAVNPGKQRPKNWGGTQPLMKFRIQAY
jgi:hypothetical protein